MADVQDRIIAQLDRLEAKQDRDTREIFEKLDGIRDAQIEKPLHESPCKFLRSHEKEHEKNNERWWSGFLKPLATGVVGGLVVWAFQKFGVKAG